MKLFIKILVVLAATIFSELVVARDTFMTAPIEKIKVVNVAPAVQEQLKKASPDERSKLEDAINTGNLFIPLQLSGDAYDTEPDNKDWDDDTAPLIALGRDEWTQHYQWLEMNRKTIQLGKDTAYTTRLTCPQISLVAIQRDKEDTTLVYRAAIVGAEINYQGNLYDFNSEGAGEVYELRIELDSRALVNKVTPPDQWVTWSYTVAVGVMKRFLGDHGYAGASSKEQINKMIKTYQQAISKIEKSAIRFCK